MNRNRLAGHAAAATAGSGVWLLGIHMPGTAPNAALYAVTILPWLVATLSLATAHHVDVLEQRQPRPTPKLAVRPAPTRRELVR